MKTSVEIRNDLVDILELDLVGPRPGSTNENEVLTQAPSRWYLTGFLVPYEAPESQRSDATGSEELDVISKTGGLDDETKPEQASARRAFFPSSIGVSILVPQPAKKCSVHVVWADYRLDGVQWQRVPRTVTVDVPIGTSNSKPASVDIPDSGGLRLVTSVRTVPESRGGLKLVPPGTRSVSLFLVNYRNPQPDERKDEGMAFQAGFTVHLDQPLVPRPNLRGLDTDDWDEQVASLQYRDAYEYAVGHGLSTTAVVDKNGQCNEVSTAWIPSAEVEKIEPASVQGIKLSTLSMDALAKASTPEELREMLSGFVAAYDLWINDQRSQIRSLTSGVPVAEELLKRAGFANKRIADGIEELSTPDVFESFQIANKVMAAAARQRLAQLGEKVAEPRWRPFQLAFILVNLRGIANPSHTDREIVDLLFFPTGGGKTEAYLGLAAFTLVLRRLRNPGISGAGVSVLMRYTLRLLTLDQLGRAAALICALELEREKDVSKLGTWPFEIGLWVGQAATPNRMGRKGDGDSHSARKRTMDYQGDDRKPSPIPLASCPWCGKKFTKNSFSLKPTTDNPNDLRIFCVNRDCVFKGNRPLPIIAVDEPIYRRLPCFIIATVDKFANLPWVGPTGALFGKVDRSDKEGFYGLCDPGQGTHLEKPLLPPDLIIQDELHLISGPLGTMVGLYETAIDALSSREDGGRTIRPKIVASTATVRRAETQIQGLFARHAVEVFPPPGPDRRDSFFAVTVSAETKNARRYVGIAAQGRSLKVVLLRTYLALLSAAQRAYIEAGGGKNPENPADPYMTLVGYFNSLRELGGSRRIVEDEVTNRLQAYSRRLRLGESAGPFADRQIDYDVVELTSREPTGKVAESKRRLALPFNEKDHVDVALATNMISVGLDIQRLGLMVVLGQPKMTAEYIQATSRVGREDTLPGLVVTLLNIHRPRDRSHYERFQSYHQSFYRAVEATSVTPFSPRAIDRGIAAVTVALARLGWPQLTAALQASKITEHRSSLDFVGEALARRAETHDPRLTKAEAAELRQKLKARTGDLLDEWSKIADRKIKVGGGLQYQSEEGTAPPLLHDPLDPKLQALPAGERKFRANRSLRDVEPSVNLWVRRLDGIELEEVEE